MSRAEIAFGSEWEKEKEAAAVAANDGVRVPRRKKLPRTMDRTPKPWMTPILDLPSHTANDMLALRKDVLKLTRADASALLRVARNTVWDWESGYRSAPFSAFVALTLISKGNPAAPQAPLALELATTMDVPEADRFVSKRARAAQLQERMLMFSKVYNAARLLRDAWHGPGLRRREYATRLAAVVATEMQRTSDHEALLYALADALYCSPIGVPWEA